MRGRGRRVGGDRARWCVGPGLLAGGGVCEGRCWRRRRSADGGEWNDLGLWTDARREDAHHFGGGDRNVRAFSDRTLASRSFSHRGTYPVVPGAVRGEVVVLG